MNIDGLSLSLLVAELNDKLAGARVDKVFQPDKYALLIWLRQPGETIPLYISANPEYPRICLTGSVPQNPAVPPVFTMLLRKHLEDGRIAGIKQHGLDRIVTIFIDIRGERGLIVTKELTVEIMGKHSNIILQQDGIIIDAIRRVNIYMSRFRQVLPGREYKAPPDKTGINLLACPAEELINTLRRHPNPRMAIAKAIVDSTTGIGPVTAREIAYRAVLPPDFPAVDIDNTAQLKLENSISEIIAQLKTEPAPVIITSTDGSRILGIAAFDLKHLHDGVSLKFNNMSEALEYAANFQGKPQNPEKLILQKFLAAELGKLQRKEAALATDAEQAEHAEEVRLEADILMTYFHTIKPGAKDATLPNLFAENPETQTLTIALNPLLSPRENAGQLYNKYNKMKRAKESLARQLEECKLEEAYLDTISVALDTADNLQEFSEIRQELIAAGYIKEKTKRRPPAVSSPLQAKSSDNINILIGKNNRQNDLVTFKQSLPDDLWFHTKDIPGSHVILRCSGFEPSAEAITESAVLAAYYSKARQSGNVPVDYTRRRYVKKPAGSKPGFVIYDHQKTIYVSPDEKAVNALLFIQSAKS